MSGRITSFTARDDYTGELITSIFTEAAQTIVINEDGSITAKVIYMEGPISLIINMELDIKSLIPAPDKPQLERESGMFDSWNQSYGGAPATGIMPRTPGGR